MHGKILRYSTQTKNGVIINVNKKIFELREKNWHDRRMMPNTGTLVEFRLDDRGDRVASCRASRYQDFPESSLVRETDFWHTDTDEELKTKEEQARETIIKQIFNETNYIQLNKIELSTSILESIKDYFKEEFNALSSLPVTDNESENSQVRINYLIMKPYLTKAIDYLVFNDRHITIDNFTDELQILKKLEYSYKQFQTNVNLTPDKIYQECFLEVQYHFRGVLRAIDFFNEKKLSLQNKIRIGSMELRSIQSKLDSKTANPNLLEEQRTKIKAGIAKAEADINTIGTVVERLKILASNFKKENLTNFESVFHKMYGLLISKTKEAMDICASHIDDKLWKLGMSSLAIKNIFFKNNINNPFCSMTFLGNHIKMLDKSKLRENEYSIYQYYQKYMAKNAKNFLIFTDNSTFGLELKIKIMSASKLNNVMIFHKEIEYFSAVNSQNFALIYVDSESRFSSPASIIKIGKQSKRNKTTNFYILSMADLKTFEL